MEAIFNQALTLFGVQQENVEHVKVVEEAPLRSSSSGSTSSSCSSESFDLRSCLKTKRARAEFRSKSAHSKTNYRHVHFDAAAEEKAPGRMGRRYSITRSKRI
eukprot:770934-Rhodomonas_salina.1